MYGVATGVGAATSSAKAGAHLAGAGTRLTGKRRVGGRVPAGTVAASSTRRFAPGATGTSPKQSRKRLICRKPGRIVVRVHRACLRRVFCCCDSQDTHPILGDVTVQTRFGGIALAKPDQTILRGGFYPTPLPSDPSSAGASAPLHSESCHDTNLPPTVTRHPGSRSEAGACGKGRRGAGRCRATAAGYSTRYPASRAECGAGVLVELQGLLLCKCSVCLTRGFFRALARRPLMVGAI